jgi:hypothetical protein
MFNVLGYDNKAKNPRVKLLKWGHVRPELSTSQILVMLSPTGIPCIQIRVQPSERSTLRLSI